MTTEINPAELLHGVEQKQDFKKEFLLKEKLYSINYRSYQEDWDIFNIYFSKEKDFLEQKKNLKKGEFYKIVITFPNWGLSRYELKPPEKKFIKCTIIDIRNVFLKIKTISYEDT